jgi:vacuolar protein sorting-associated protein 13A/C
MFEKIVADILGSVLGPYIEGLNAETLKLAVWSGNIQFSNLKVKKEVLDPLGVPFAIKAGMIGTLEMNFPWRNFLSGSTVLRLSDLCVLLVPSKAHMVRSSFLIYNFFISLN